MKVALLGLTVMVIALLAPLEPRVSDRPAWSFLATAPQAAARPEGLKVELRPFQAPARAALVRFTNLSARELGIFKPLDGSEWEWHQPFYRFIITNDQGEALPLGGRCWTSGLWADTQWPDDYLIVLKPGEVYEKWVIIPCRIPAADRYLVSFEYVYDKVPAGKGLELPVPPGAWIGRAVAAPVMLELKP